jgi:hypothetical protein
LSTAQRLLNSKTQKEFGNFERFSMPEGGFAARGATETPLAPDVEVGGGTGSERPRSKRRPFFLMPELFIYPLALVASGVFVYVLLELFFGASAEETRPVGQLIEDLRTQGFLDRQAQSRAAHALAMRATEMESEGRKLSPEETRKLIEACRSSRSSPTIHQCLVLALGRAGEEAEALPLLSGILADPGNDAGSRIEAIRGLGLTRSADAVAPLRAALKEAASEDWELRAAVLQALTNIAARTTQAGVRDEVREVLRSNLGDPSGVVARNAAMWLADVYRDPAGVATLRLLLDWEYLDRQRFNPEEKDVLMCRSIQCLLALRDEESLAVIRRRADENRSYKVKNAALVALRDWTQDPRARVE